MRIAAAACAAVQLLTPSPCQQVEPEAGSAKLFHRLSAEQTGVRFQNDIEADHPMCRLYHGGFLCGGVAIGDIDGDGRPDLYLVGGPGPNRLYRQVDTLRFEDATESAGVDLGEGWGAGAAMVDIDDDGDLDIYVCNYDAPNQLYLNDGKGRFVERAAQRGLAVVDACLMPSFADYDRDGDLDLYLLTYRYEREGGRPETSPMAYKDGKPFVAAGFEKYYAVIKKKNAQGQLIPGVHEYGRPDYLFRHDADGTFTDVTRAAGIAGHGHGNSATWWDYNADGWPDIYVCNDFDDPDRLYRNNRDGTFTEVSAEVAPHTTWFSMGSDAADLNNDGWIDFVALDMSGTTHVKQKTTMGAMSAAKLEAVAGPPPQLMRNMVLLSTGTGRCFEAAFMLGVANSDWSWAAKLADFDLDGRVDLFISNGMTRDFTHSDIPFDSQMLIGQGQFEVYKDKPSRPERNLAFRNEGDLRFEDVSRAWGLDQVGISCGAALSDLDGDGDLDLVVQNLDEPVAIYRNDARGSWLTVRLRGTKSNRFGIGATVRVETTGGSQTRQLSPHTGFASSNEPLVHFGLGQERGKARLTIEWPCGGVQEVRDLEINRSHTIVEKSGNEAAAAPGRTPLFVRSPVLAGARHREREFDDFRAQPLLPNKLSQLGPGQAWGDIDGDGDEDLFLGGATGQPGMLFRNDGAEGFVPLDVPDLRHDLRCEDMGALLFEADGDGDLDLYVVSGGVENRARTLLYDRLYLNDGRGGFRRAPRGSLPAIAQSGSVVTAADFDRDGDLDLFVGGRVIRASYPLPPTSLLLRNDGGRFADVTQELAPELARTGLVTSAVWSDADGDGWLDLLVTHEWGPVKLFRNREGRLQDRSATMRLARHTGWWNGIASGDIDGDGDIDYVVTNFGLNTKYVASAEHPALLYYGDFEGQGIMRLVEAQYEHGHLFPVRGKSCSTRAMPFLGARFKTYEAFAHADLPQLYSDQCLQSAHRFAATTLASGVLINGGAGGFRFLPLPRLAQISPGFGVVLTDFDSDGRPDVYLVQNFFGPQPETGHMDGGMSLLLAGRGDGTFEPVWPKESGLVVPGDAKSLATTDLNQDGRPDVVIGVNDGPTMCFLRTTREAGARLQVVLEGSGGNPTGVGARVAVHLDDGSKQTNEVRAGGGYLSQSTPVLTFGLGRHRAASIVVRWPDGRVTRTEAEAGRTRYVVKRPGD